MDSRLSGCRESESDIDRSANASSTSYAALSEGLTFLTEPLPRDMEIAGPVKMRLWVESTTDDMDVFATLRAFDPAKTKPRS